MNKTMSDYNIFYFVYYFRILFYYFVRSVFL